MVATLPLLAALELLDTVLTSTRKIAARRILRLPELLSLTRALQTPSRSPVKLQQAPPHILHLNLRNNSHLSKTENITMVVMQPL
jgi:hypothetical protein